MSLSRKPNRFGLNPFLAVDTAMANYYYGRTDVAPDEEGEEKALRDAAKDEGPELDRTLPWPLLVRGMFEILYKETMKQWLRRRGKSKREPEDPLPNSIVISPQEWARAFNIITFSYVENGLFRRPNVIKKRVTGDGREVALALLVQDPGKGREKMADYLSPKRRRETITVLRRMEKHRRDLGENDAVQKHLANMNPPTVVG